jgi:hypothetical protein
MGYRSEVAYAISFPDAGKKQAFVAAVKLGADEHQIEALSELDERKDTLLFGHFCDVKWYDTFEEVQAHHQLMDMVVEDFKGSYYFVRIGEEYDDVDVQSGGDYPPYEYINVHRSIEIS